MDKQTAVQPCNQTLDIRKEQTADGASDVDESQSR